MYLEKSFHCSPPEGCRASGFYQWLEHRDVRSANAQGRSEVCWSSEAPRMSHGHFWFLSFALITIPHGLLRHVYHASATPRQGLKADFITNTPSHSCKHA